MSATRMSYGETMAWGAAQYADVLALLSSEGLPATFTQTGGMCAAIEVQLETGQTLLITDAEDSLSWVRAEQTGWGVGLYEQGDDSDGATRFSCDEAADASTLLRLIREVLFGS